MYKLLIADDESIIRKGIKKLVNYENLNITDVLEAEDGKQAIELANTQNPDIILMDINMPEIDGLTAAKLIKENNSNVYIVIITGYDYFEYTQTAIRAKVDDYILKPVSKKDIEYILKSAIDKIDYFRRKKSIKNITQNETIEIDEENNLIKEYLEKNMFSIDLSLSKMAEDIGYNSNYLSVLVKQIYGLTFQDYINKKRMEKAKILLLSTDMKNYEIAENIGIEDVNYFVTKFKKYYNITPKQFKQGLRDE
ncbi:response regulator [Helcococcus ovis]|uniref:response regulator transcription factor n=1 Tax=Helcococcus ovis TaxID=72026 RepID=UPI00106FF84F|nr:response regulator [Helcococcus ovis]TFF68804.1 response regulator [Helcococcus ovis]WNZ01175.1 response regulator [Helcococcus ovis]